MTKVNPVQQWGGWHLLELATNLNHHSLGCNTHTLHSHGREPEERRRERKRDSDWESIIIPVGDHDSDNEAGKDQWFLDIDHTVPSTLADLGSLRESPLQSQRHKGRRS